MTTEHTRAVRNSAVAWFWILACIAFLAFLLHGCSAASWQRTKAHALETSIAGTGGAVAVLAGWPIGPVVFAAGMVTAAYFGEDARPPDPVTVVHEKTDKDGKTTTTVKTYQPKDTRDAPPADSGFSLSGLLSETAWTVLKWIAAAFALHAAYKYATGDRYRLHVNQGLAHLRALHPLLALKSFRKAGGAKHTAS